MLYLKELKKVMCSFFYILFAGALAVALYSQGALYFGDSRMNRPEPGGNYGVVNREIPEMIMPAALESLWQEFCENNYKTYPIGFIKNVRLDEKKQRMVAEIIAEITGEDTEAILGKQAAFEGTGDDGYSFNIGEELQMDSDGNLIFSGARDVFCAGFDRYPEKEQQYPLLCGRTGAEKREHGEAPGGGV